MSISASAQNEDNPEPVWFVYIIENRLGQLYTGVSVDPARRMRQHLGELAGGARALKGKAPLRFKLMLELPDKQSAMQLEYGIKQLTKAQKLRLIAGDPATLPSHLRAHLKT
ncbi:GIY-YIG nuclease family protein [Salinimonas marina]|uniref:GIY-YIG nuclease family protein n=1 Tax=Salinimonas marina TaxID=2785918 RepID=UPI001E4D6AD1|nr:GIY-YIG nuclease family protein [Salinimonas marina]